MTEIRPITDQTEWDSFLNSVQPNTFLHTWEWGEVNNQTGTPAERIGVYEENSLVAIALLLTVKAKRGAFIFCPHGPLFKDEQNNTEILKDIVSYASKKAATAKAVAVRIAPLLISSIDQQQVFKDLGFRPAPLHIHTELTWVRDISASEEKLLQDMRKTTRHAIKKAEQAGIKIVIKTTPDAVDDFYPLYELTRERHSFVPFSKDMITKQFEIFSKSHKAYATIAYFENNVVATALFMQCGSTVFYHHGASVKLPSSIPASHLLQWASMKEAKKRGATRYNFWGIARDEQKNHPFAGITVFKKGFGGYAVDYLHTQDKPISVLYWKLWSIEQWRKFRRGF